MFRMREANDLGKGTPIRLGKLVSLSTLDWIQAIRCSMYSGADIFVGFLNASLSCQRYSNLELSYQSLVS